jgi:hypothetical protein
MEKLSRITFIAWILKALTSIHTLTKFTPIQSLQWTWSKSSNQGWQTGEGFAAEIQFTGSEMEHRMCSADGTDLPARKLAWSVAF